MLSNFSPGIQYKKWEILPMWAGRRGETLLWVSRRLASRTENNGTRWSESGHFNSTSWRFFFLYNHLPLWGRHYYYTHYTDEGSARCRKQLSCAQSWSWRAVDRGPGPRPSTPESRVLDAPLGSCTSKACCAAEGITEAKRGMHPTEGEHHIHACPGEDDTPSAPARGQENAGSPLQPNPCSHRQSLTHPTTNDLTICTRSLLYPFVFANITVSSSCPTLNRITLPTRSPLMIFVKVRHSYTGAEMDSK